MLELKVTNQDIKLVQVTPYGSPLVSGSAGEYECRFEFDETWNGFIKTAVFEYSDNDACSNVKHEPALIEDSKCEIPVKVLKKGSRLRIGVYGVKGRVRRPTVYTESLLVRVGAMPVSPENDPTSEIYIQILNMIEKSTIPEGGTSGQILTKHSDASYDVCWENEVDWNRLNNKPFDELNPNDLEVNGLEPNRQIGVKEIPTSKVTGLDTKLNEVDSAIADKQPKGDYATRSELPTKVSQLENNKNYVDQVTLNAVEVKADNNANAIKEKADKSELAEKLNLTGGTMQGKIDMASFGIDNLPDAVKNGQPVTFKQLNDAIAGIGTVFNLKGSKPNYEALPKDDNKIGDVWFVEDESVGYIWVEKSGVPQWERFGPQIDLSGYLTKDGLLQTTGSETSNTMSQDAITKELKKKQPIGDYALTTDIPKVPEWAMASTKPVYNAQEVGALSAETLMKLAPAISITEFGKIISTNIVSSFSHKVKCRVESDNLVDYTIQTATSGNYMIPVKIFSGEFIVKIFNADGTETGISSQETFTANLRGEYGVVIVADITKPIIIDAETASKVRTISIYFNKNKYFGAAENVKVQMCRPENADKFYQYVSPSSVSVIQEPGDMIFNPAADGVVSNINSLSPSMTIMADSPGVNVEVTYNADTKGYIDREIEKIRKDFIPLQNVVLNNI